MDALLDFLTFKDPNATWVVVAVLFMCASSAIVGVFAFLRKRALIGDAISHAILPGVCLAFLLTHSRNPLILMAGAIASGWLGLMSINLIVRHSKLKTDAALSLVLSVFYGVGILILTAIQGSGLASQAGLDKFLFGKAAALVREDVIIFSVFGAILILVVIVFYHPFRILTFDRDYARAIGLPVKAMEMLMSLLTVFTIALGIQAVGVVLMAALLIAPAAAARYWTDRLPMMILIAALFAMGSGWVGAFVSYTIPRMPTGPWIVSVLALAAILSVLLGRKKGVLAAEVQRARNQKKMLRENILKCLYHLGESASDFEQPWTFSQMVERRYFKPERLKRGVKRLTRKGLVEQLPDGIRLSPEGIEEGMRVVRIHRLWELYLTTYLQLPPDHVHEDAEAIEHIITPELEKELEHQLDRPVIDPHQSPIPYKK